MALLPAATPSSTLTDLPTTAVSVRDAASGVNSNPESGALSDGAPGLEAGKRAVSAIRLPTNAVAHTHTSAAIHTIVLFLLMMLLQKSERGYMTPVPPHA
jgi:hypothetical protein